MLPKEEYVEQAYFFQMLLDRLGQGIPLQDLLEQSKYELLSTTKLPMAIDLMLGELKHHGQMSTGMSMLSHYFVAFQTFLVSEAELDRGKFDYQTALKILQAEALYRSKSEISPQGLFFYQFEAVSRNRLNYDRGLLAMSKDPTFPPEWKEWILIVRQQLGLGDLAEMIYVRSEFHREKKSRLNNREFDAPLLFGIAEGRIAFANSHKDPLFLFAAMQRHLGYPPVPRLEAIDPLPTLVPLLQRKMERLEARIKLLEEEERGGIDITKFYEGGRIPPPGDDLLD